MSCFLIFFMFWALNATFKRTSNIDWIYWRHLEYEISWSVSKITLILVISLIKHIVYNTMNLGPCYGDGQDIRGYKSARFGDTSLKSQHTGSQLSCFLPKFLSPHPHAYNLHFIQKMKAGLLQPTAGWAHSENSHIPEELPFSVFTSEMWFESSQSIYYPSHQSSFDVLLFYSICHKSFSWFSRLVSTLAFTFWT